MPVKRPINQPANKTEDRSKQGTDHAKYCAENPADNSKNPSYYTAKDSEDSADSPNDQRKKEYTHYDNQ